MCCQASHSFADLMGATFQADHTERSADQDRLSIETLLTPSSAHPMNGSFRRVSPIAPNPRRRSLDRTDTGRSALVAGTGPGEWLEGRLSARKIRDRGHGDGDSPASTRPSHWPGREERWLWVTPALI